jgi:transcriptional regulator NrdR family protein
VRFASVYRSFQDIDEFRQEIERISTQVIEKTQEEG